jgi:two-component system response regulator FimZ (fimbrial Z protein)
VTESQIGYAAAPTVAIVEDYSDIRELLRTQFVLDGRFDVVGEAGDGLTGMSMIEDLHPDVVILDLMLPKLDGISVLDRIKDDCPGSRVVVFSSFTNPTVEQRRTLSRADRYVEKGSRTNLLSVAAELLAHPVH